MADRLKKMAMSDDKDRFEDLPEDLLKLLLSFLPSRDAVRTSALGRRWRNLWKSVPSLCIYTDEYNNEYEDVQAFNNFVENLLAFRDRTAPLDLCVIDPYPGGDQCEAHQDVESWVQYAISCKVSVLRIHNSCSDHQHMQLPNRTVISKYLTVLDLYHLEFEGHPLDLLSCPALEVLEIEDCAINLGGILPKSLQHLKIKNSPPFSTHTAGTRLSAPGLVTLELDDCFERSLLPESLPSLVTAYIKIVLDSEDHCCHNYFGDCGNESCDACYGFEDDCSVLIEGLSGATNLELITVGSMIFRKDLKWCPMFSKLKTVLLNEWCVGANFTGLVYFLQHAPILERLTLQLPYHKYACIETGESYNPKEHFLVSEHLKIVKIYCREEEETICQILMILVTHGVNPAKINIKHDFRDSSLFSFKQKN